MTKMFKHATGHTPWNICIPMKQAGKLLKTTDLSVQNIAYSIGYSDTKFL